MSKKKKPSFTSCDSCVNNVYDEELECYSCEIDLDEDETPEFRKTKYILHVLGVLYPDSSKTLKENTEYLGAEDYRLKKECYERVYGRALDYGFEKLDIAGWKGAIS